MIFKKPGNSLKGIDNKTVRGRIGGVTFMCRNDELSWLFTNRFSAIRYMKFKIMGLTEILRRIRLFFANTIKSSESFRKQPTQLIVELKSLLRHIIFTRDLDGCTLCFFKSSSQ
jgi:hypothetical protein